MKITPAEVLDRLREDVEYSKDDAKAYLALADSAAYEHASKVMSRMMITCGTMALETGETERFKGYLDGLNAFFELVQGGAHTARGLVEEQVYKHKQEMEEGTDEEDEPDLSMAISSLGSSSL